MTAERRTTDPPAECVFCRGDKKLCEAGAGDPLC